MESEAVMRTQYIIIHKTKTRVYISKYNLAGSKLSMTWKVRQ